MVSQMVEMERSYLTAEVFREILASSHATDDLSEDAGARVSFWTIELRLDTLRFAAALSRHAGVSYVSRAIIIVAMIVITEDVLTASTWLQQGCL